jgi:hypothetical protein
VTHRFGAGAALLMQFPLKDAYLDYLSHADAAAPEFAALSAIEAIAQEMGLEAGVHSSNRQIEACVRETPEGTLLVFLVNHEGDSPETTVGVGNAPPQPFVQDLVTGEAVPGASARDGRLVLRAEVPFGETRLLGVFPYRTTGLALRLERDEAAPGDSLAATATVNGAGDPRGGNSLLDITVRGPDGRVREAFSGARCTLGRSLRLDLRLPDNAQRGRWCISVSRPWTHEEAHASFRVRSSSAVSRP